MHGSMSGLGMTMGQGAAPGMMPMMGMMDPTRHTEDLIASLRTEFKIVEARNAHWSAFADALRANGKHIGDLSAEMMGPSVMMSGKGEASAL